MVVSEAAGADGASAVAPPAGACGCSAVSEAGGTIGLSPGGPRSSGLGGLPSTVSCGRFWVNS